MDSQMLWWPSPHGPARVIVPIVASDAADADRQAQAIADCDADLVEWRADAWSGVLTPGEAVELSCRLRNTVAPKPLIFTWRTAGEGGCATPAADERYREITAAVIDARSADLADVQINHPAAVHLLDTARNTGMPVIGSWHDVNGTPESEAIVAALAQAEVDGASVAKVAVTPHNPADVAALLSATAERAAVARVPLVTMAMGSLGLVSRVFGYVFGSQATFAVVGQSSAPGQPSLLELRKAWDSSLGVAGQLGPA